MSRPKRCEHSRFHPECRSCRGLQRRWYARLKSQGFVDIEYGRETPRFIAHTADPNSPSALESQDFYNQVWRIFHLWMTAGRAKRDCRVAELYAAQEKGTGTVRGIARRLKAENLPPWRTESVQRTLREIREAIHTGISEIQDFPSIYVSPRHKAA